MGSDLTRDQLRKMKLVDCGGILVDRDSLRIAERINEYDPNLTLQYLEQAERLDEPPFRVLERCPDGLQRVVLTAWALDERLLQRIYQADTTRFDIDARLTKQNEQARANKRRRYEEKILEETEVVKAILKSPKQSYTAKIPQPDGDTKKVKFE